MAQLTTTTLLTVEEVSHKHSTYLRPSRLSTRKPSASVAVAERNTPGKGFASKSPRSTMARKSQAKTFNYFPDLPPYSNPTTGLISKLPVSWIPYAQCMRLDRPAGFYAFYFPYLIAIAYSACIAEETPSPLVLARLAAILFPFNILLRGVACTFNDNVDQEFDRQVTRCRHRPIARGALSTTAANVFTVVQAILMLPFLNGFPKACKIHMAIATVLFLIYALMKRITYYPQVFLGFPFAWAIPFCMAALGMGSLGTTPDQVWATLALFGANILWTTTYDTIYAHQDVVDDEKAGVKGMALRFRNSTKSLGSLLATGQVLLLALCGIWAGFSPVYFIGTVGGVAAAMTWYIWSVDLSNPASCGAWFHDQFWIVGAGFLAGLLGEYALKITS